MPAAAAGRPPSARTARAPGAGLACAGRAGLACAGPAVLARAGRPALARTTIAGARVALPLAVALLAACATPAPRPPLGELPGVREDPPPVSGTRLGAAFREPAARLGAFDRVWRLVADRHYDPALNGVDWRAAAQRHRPRIAAARSDREVYRILKDLVGELDDSHTVVLTARETVRARRFASARFGITLATVSAGVAIAAVEPGSAAERAGLRAGDLLLAVDGRPLAAGAAAAAAPVDDGLEAGALRPDPGPGRRPARATSFPGLPRGEPDVDPPELELTIVRAPLAPWPVRVQPELRARAPQVTRRWLDDGVLVIGIEHFDPAAPAGLDAALAGAGSVRALILDLRGNRGGAFEAYRRVTARFLPGERVVLQLVQRAADGSREQRIVDLVLGDPGAVGAAARAPLAVLVDGRTASAAELAALTLVEQRGAVLVGEPTCGCATGVRSEYPLPDGGGVRIAETGFISARGRRIEGEPLVPAVRVAPELSDLRAGRDPVLLEARRRLLARIEPGGLRP